MKRIESNDQNFELHALDNKRPLLIFQQKGLVIRDSKRFKITCGSK